MPYPMTDVRLPPSARGVARPASRDPIPSPPRQVQRNQMVQAWNDALPKPPPPVDHSRRQLEPPPPAPPRPVDSAAASSFSQLSRDVDRFTDEVRHDQMEAKAAQIQASMAQTSPTYTPSPSPE
eukprot:1645893-Karenia_brevis.AAC.1